MYKLDIRLLQPISPRERMLSFASDHDTGQTYPNQQPKPQMFPSLFTAPLRVKELFSDPFRFSVPSYQRRYSWTVKEAGQLLDDILVAAAENPDSAEPDYFLGAILLTDSGAQTGWRLSPPRSPRVLDIVDGQQRLITLTILLAMLRDLTVEDDKGLAQALNRLVIVGRALNGRLKHRLQLRGSDDAFLVECVLRPNACRSAPPFDDLEPGAAAILEVREHFRSELQPMPAADRYRLVQYILNCCHAVVIVTNDIDRGHRMFSVLNDRGRPLARKDIIKAEILGGFPPERADTLLAGWADAERRLGEEFDSFLSHVRTIEGKGRLPIIAGIRAVRAECGGSEPFMNDLLLPYVDAFDIITRARHEGAPESAEISRRLKYLSWLGSSEWIPATMKWLRLHRSDPAQILKFLEVVEPFAFSLRLLCIGAGKRATRFAALLPAINDGSIFDAEHSPCVLTRDEQRHICYNLRNLHERHPQTCKLVLMRLNDELAGAPQHLDPAEWTVEHVLPQSPGRNGQWRVWFPDNDERELLTQSLGNLVLVRRTQNDKASNQDFARKKAIYFKHAQGEMPAITREIATAETWTPVHVREREERFLQILSAIWRLDLSAMQLRENDPQSFVRRRRKAS